MTNYFSIQHFRMTNLSFIILKKIPLCMRLIAIMLFVCIGLAYASDSYSQSATLTTKQYKKFWTKSRNNLNFVFSTTTNK